jgi:hypothetical protein
VWMVRDGRLARNEVFVDRAVAVRVVAVPEQ